MTGKMLFDHLTNFTGTHQTDPKDPKISAEFEKPTRFLLQLRVKLYSCLLELAFCTQRNICGAVLSVRSAPSVGGRAAVYSTQWADAYSRDTPGSGTSAYFLSANTPSSERKHRYSFNEGRDLSERKERAVTSGRRNACGELVIFVFLGWQVELTREKVRLPRR